MKKRADLNVRPFHWFGLRDRLFHQYYFLDLSVVSGFKAGEVDAGGQAGGVKGDVMDASIAIAVDQGGYQAAGHVVNGQI